MSSYATFRHVVRGRAVGFLKSEGWKLEPLIPIKEKTHKIGKLEDMRSRTKAFKLQKSLRHISSL